MLKWYSQAIVFQEIPDEITLALEISNCPHLCANCHSPWLRKDLGTLITYDNINNLIKKYEDNITCICFMGGDSDHKWLGLFAEYIHEHSDLKVAMYSGDDEIDPNLINILDYYKIGSYQKDKGPLDKKTTNQRLLKITRNSSGQKIEDITSRFWES